VTKDRPGFVRAVCAASKVVGELRLSSDGDAVRVEIEPVEPLAPDPLGLSPAQRRVLDALAEPDTPRSTDEIGDWVVTHGWPAGLHRVTIQKALKVLSERGLADSGMGKWWGVPSR
jgi:hypothetical protein